MKLADTILIACLITGLTFAPLGCSGKKELEERTKTVDKPGGSKFLS